MPIDRAKLNEPQLPLDKQIVEFLGQEPEQAFSLTEIACGLHGCDALVLSLTASLSESEDGQQAFYQRYYDCMHGLAINGAVISAVVRETRYYALAVADKDNESCR
jgi:hypothetical protein